MGAVELAARDRMLNTGAQRVLVETTQTLNRLYRNFASFVDVLFVIFLKRVAINYEQLLF